MLGCGISRSQAFIGKMFKQMNITRKRLTHVPTERNSARVLEIRKIYGIEIQNVPINNVVYLDETGFNLHTCQNYDYSTKNSKAYVVVSGNKGINISLMASISINEIVGFYIIDGACNGDSFIDFILTKLVTYFERNKEKLVIMDN